jgi:hypothetical protein
MESLMATFWFKVLMLAACLGGVIAAQMYLGDLAQHGGLQSAFDDPDRELPPLEVETEATHAVLEGDKDKSNQ